jgi:hypothetical protein
MKLVLVLLIATILVVFVENRKKKKKAKQPKKPENPLDRRPDKIKPELYCDACIAMVKETVKELRGKKKESDVIAIIENVCDPEKYYTYRKLYYNFILLKFYFLIKQITLHQR